MTLLIQRQDQLRALASPLRQEIVDALQASPQGSTIAALAQRLNRRPDSLYFHLRALQRVALVRRIGHTGVGRDRAALYALPDRPARIAYPPAKRSGHLAPVLDAILRLARRDVRRALALPAVRAEGDSRQLWVARARGWLRPDQLARANALLNELFDLLNQSPPAPDTEPIALAFALTPLAESKARAPKRPTAPMAGPRRAAPKADIP